MAGQDDFLATYTPLANDIATQTGIDPSVVLGIIDTETGGGQHVKGNNIFGISPGGKVAGYPDVQTAAQAFVNLMQTGRYRGVAGAGGPADQAAALARSGYNTVNPQYASIVANKAASFGKQLGYQDDGQGGGTTQAQAPDYNTPSPAAAAPAPTSAKEAAAAELGTDTAAQPPAATSGASQPGSAKAAANAELSQPVPPGTETGPPGTETGPPERKPLSVGQTVGEGAQIVDPATGMPIPIPQPAVPRQYQPPSTDLSGGYISPTGDYVPPQAIPGVTPSPTVQPAAPRIGLPPTLRPAQPAPSTDFWAPGGRDIVANMDPYGVGRYILAPAGDILGAGLGAASTIGTAFRGAQGLVQGALNPLDPQLARDIAALPEAFPLGGAELGGLTPRPPATTQAARNALGRPVTVADLTGAIRRADEAAAAGEPPRPTPGAPPAASAAPAGAGERPTPSAGPVPEADHVSASEAPRPQSVGAAGTPQTAVPDQTNLERARNLRVQINQSARDRAGPNLIDDTAYVTDVPGGTLPERMLPERNFDPQMALDHKRRYESSEGQDYRRTFDANTTARNQGMADLLRQDAGDGLTLDQARSARRAAAPEAFGAFDGEQPVNAAGYVDNIQSILEGPQGKREAVERTLNSVQSRMYDPGGNLETQPSQLYGVKQHIDDLLEKAQRPTDREGTDAAASQAILRNLKDRMDDLIQSGAPKYADYRQAYRDLSQPVNQQRFLQRYQEGSKKLTNAAGDLQIGQLNQMLEDIHKGLTDSRNNLAKSLADQQIQNIVNVRNEVATKQLSEIQARVKGADTFQKINAAAQAGQGPLGRAVRGAAELGAHGVMGLLATQVHPAAAAINALMAADRMITRPARLARREARRQTAATAAKNALDARMLSQEPANPLGMY